MWIYRNRQSVLPAPSQKHIAFVGAGGKTSLAEYMAVELLKEGKTVAITTTTKIFVKDPFCLIEEDFTPTPARPFMRIGGSIENGKLTAVSFDDLLALGSVYDIILTEADGAKERPLKFPAAHEPVIPPFVDAVFVVAGLDSLLGKIDEKVFRWEAFCNATGARADSPVTPEVFLRFFAGDAFLKGVDRQKCIVVLNKYDALKAREEAVESGRRIIAQTGLKEVIVASVLHKVFYEISG